jgi:hypothetical protein
MAHYARVFSECGIKDSASQARFRRFLDEVCTQEGVSAGDIVGVGEHGTGGKPDLYVAHRKAIVRVSERGVFNKRIELQRICSVAAIAQLNGTQEGFKGTDITLTGTDDSGRVVLKIIWGLGGPDWVEPLVQRQRENLLEVISAAMDRGGDGPSLPPAAAAASKAGAILDWAAEVVKTSGVAVTQGLVEEHANMIAAVIRMFVFLPVAGVDDFKRFYPDGQMPQGSIIDTFDDLYARVVARVGSPRPVDEGIDRYLRNSFNEYVQGCRTEYG